MSKANFKTSSIYCVVLFWKQSCWSSFSSTPALNLTNIQNLRLCTDWKRNSSFHSSVSIVFRWTINIHRLLLQLLPLVRTSLSEEITQLLVVRQMLVSTVLHTMRKRTWNYKWLLSSVSIQENKTGNHLKKTVLNMNNYGKANFLWSVLSYGGVFSPLMFAACPSSKVHMEKI